MTISPIHVQKSNYYDNCIMETFFEKLKMICIMTIRKTTIISKDF